MASLFIYKVRAFLLKYRGSDNYFSAQAFHQKCDNVGPTITVVKSEFGEIFGGYTSKPW